MTLVSVITENTVCPKVDKYGAECPMDVDNECLSDQECSAGRKCCPSPFDDEACQLLCLEAEPQSKIINYSKLIHAYRPLGICTITFFVAHISIKECGI